MIVNVKILQYYLLILEVLHFKIVLDNSLETRRYHFYYFSILN